MEKQPKWSNLRAESTKMVVFASKINQSGLIPTYYITCISQRVDFCLHVRYAVNAFSTAMTLRGDQGSEDIRGAKMKSVA